MLSLMDKELDRGIFMNRTAELMEVGRHYEADGKLDKAYKAYHTVAQSGNTEGMIALGNLYYHKKYKANTRFWGTPDFTAAFSWFLKAAEAGSALGMRKAGIMLFNGIGCDENEEEAHKWLQKAALAGNVDGMIALKNFFGEQGYLADSDYEAILSAFCAFVERGDREQANQYYQVLSYGTDRQLCRLGLRLAVGRYNQSQLYHAYSYPAKSNGRPCAPVAHIRIGWESLVMVNLAAFPHDKAVLGFASDIEQQLVPIAGMRQRAGQARYQATPFGWLKAARRARLLEATSWTKEEVGIRLAHEVQGDNDRLEQYQQMLLQIDPQADEAFFIEGGEKEYTVEITWLEADSMQVLCRYTIGAPDQGEDELACVSDVCVSEPS